jgi:hypothetical protein
MNKIVVSEAVSERTTFVGPIIPAPVRALPKLLAKITPQVFTQIKSSKWSLELLSAPWLGKTAIECIVVVLH